MHTFKEKNAIQGLPWLRICCSQHFSQMEKLEPNEIHFSQGFSQKVASTSYFVLNSLPASVDFCCLLITFANSLDPDQARQNVRSNLFDTHMVLTKSGIQRVK